MATLSGPTLDYYYDDYIGWYDLRVIPEPSTTGLLVGGVALVFGLFRKRK